MHDVRYDPPSAIRRVVNRLANLRDEVPLLSVRVSVLSIVSNVGYKYLVHNMKSSNSSERPEHAPSPAGASIAASPASKPTATSENSAAGDGCCVSACSDSSFSLGAAAFMSSCLTMLLEHGVSPLFQVGPLQMWEELTANLILAGKIPPPESWGEKHGTQERIEARLRDVSERHRLHVERHLTSRRVSLESGGNPGNPKM